MRLWAQEDGIPELFNAEFGCVQQPQNQSEAISNLQYWYDMTAAYSKGTIVLDNPSSIANAQPYKDTWISEWFQGVATP